MILGICIIAILVILGGLRTYLHWTNVRYAGEVTSVIDGAFRIQTESGTEIIVNQNQDVRIRKGMKVWEGSIKLGDFVIVAGTPNQDGSFEARVIRIMTLPPPSLYENNLQKNN